MNQSTRHQIPLGNGASYGIFADDEMLRALGPAILRYLGCSFEIKWPEEHGLTEERDAARKHLRARLNEESEEYSYEAAKHPSERPMLAEAFRAGWRRAPKGTRFPGGV